jgi:hypothetical protein
MTPYLSALLDIAKHYDKMFGEGEALASLKARLAKSKEVSHRRDDPLYVMPATDISSSLPLTQFDPIDSNPKGSPLAFQGGGGDFAGGGASGSWDSSSSDSCSPSDSGSSYSSDSGSCSSGSGGGD